MYESFFGCRQRPFAAAPHVERYFPGRTIDAARQTIERCVGRAEGAALLIGPAGTGKSLLCAKIAETFRSQYAVVRLANGGLATRRAFFQAVLYELNLPYRGIEEGELRLSLVDRLTVDAADRGMLLIVDDAHTLPLRLLEEIRMLADLSRRGEPRVRLVLAGAPSLEERIAVPRLSTLQQRITSRCYLEALDRSDTFAYVRQQIMTVGGDPNGVFTEAALDAVYRATEGIPRLINQTCDHAMVLACAGGVKPIDGSGIDEAWADLQQLPTPWSRAQGYSGPTSDDGVIEFLSGDVTPPVETTPIGAAGDLCQFSPDVIELVPAAPQIGNPPAEDTLDVIETHLADWESEFTPVAKSEPEIELVLNGGGRDPFLEDFVEEEVVVDRYAEADRLGGPRVQVYGSEARILSALADAQRVVRETPPKLKVAEQRTDAPVIAPQIELVDEPADEVSAGPQPHTRFIRESDPVEPEDTLIVPRRPTGDAEIIVVEDDPGSEGGPAPEASVVRSNDYGRMFARLRHNT